MKKFHILFFIVFINCTYSQLFDDVIVLDAGHGGSDVGALGYNGNNYPYEKDLNLYTSMNADIMLSDNGIFLKVVATRVDDSDMTFDDRGRIINGDEPDQLGRQVFSTNTVQAFVSVHYNSSGSASARGTEVYCYADMGSDPPTLEPENDMSSSCEGLIFGGIMIDNILEYTEGLYYRNPNDVWFDATLHGGDGIYGNNWNIFGAFDLGTTNFAALLIEFEFASNPDVWEIIEPLGVYYDLFYHVRAGEAVMNSYFDYIAGADPHDFHPSALPCFGTLQKYSPEPLSISITGSTILNPGQYGSWEANPSGGIQAYHYQWYYMYPDNPLIRKPGTGYWISVGSDDPSLTRYDDETFQLKCVVTDNANNTATSNILTVDVGVLSKKGDVEKLTKMPLQNELRQNYPNPFNPSTNIKYSIKQKGMVTLKVFNSIGQEIASMVNEVKEPGRYSVDFDAYDLPSGIYFYQLITNDFQEIKKMMLIK